MERRLEEVLKGREGNYIVPFFWQHGESEETLRAYMEKIHMSGIRAVCVESRPHPDYVGAGWWRDMDVILEEAAARGMRVWVLDDAHFPTGYCNGQIPSHPEYGKVFLDHYTVDVMGPDREASFLIRLEEEEELVGVVAVSCRGISEEAPPPVDITSCVRDGIVYWPVPDGYWHIVVLKTLREGDKCRKNYCNLLDRDAVAFFLDTVYEPHWQHYGERFGNVFAGFFSDEPEFGNTFGEYPDTGIGQPTMLLPWSRELAECCAEAWGEEKNFCLAALWSELKGYTERARYGYMTMATELYSRNFCVQVGKWCADHGVEYIGHVVEDNGNHARTGYGTGHFFKALWGQHMSGIDVVLQQIRPGYDDRDFYHIGGKNTYDGRFFHYGLGKMGSSLARLDGKKMGRTICEVYGAYGWTEGLKLMKWIADHMLVRGVNWFVPHAFTPAPFPDPDCPPHFYAQGRNPQFPWFRDLMIYMNRMCHLFNGGDSVIHTALLYTAEMSWMGDCMPFEEVGKWLMRSQIDFDVVPIWLLGESRFSEDGTAMQVGNASYSVLIVPDCAFIPEEMARWIERAAQAAFPVVFVGEYPEVIRTGEMGVRKCAATGGREEGIRKAANIFCRSSEEDIRKAAGIFCRGREEEIRKAAGIFCGGSREKLLASLKEDIREIRTSEPQPWLRYHQYRQPEGMFYLFFNEHPTEQVDTWVEVKGLREATAPDRLRAGSMPAEERQNSSGAENIAKAGNGICQETDQYTIHGDRSNAYWYDGWDNCLYGTEQNDRGQICLRLAPYETKVLYCGNVDPGMEMPDAALLWGRDADRPGRSSGIRRLELTGVWRVSFREYNEDQFGQPESWTSLKNVTGQEQRPEFSGTVRYEISFDWDPETDGGTALLDCGQVYETLEVRLNGICQAVRVAPPYTLLLKGLRKGKNDLELLVTNTLVHKMRDSLSATMPVEASGMLGPVWLKGANFEGCGA